MRYAAMSKNLTTDQIASAVKSVGAKEVKEANLVEEVFCELDDEQLEKLSKTNIDVKPVRVYYPQRVPLQLPIRISVKVPAQIKSRISVQVPARIQLRTPTRVLSPHTVRPRIESEPQYAEHEYVESEPQYAEPEYIEPIHIESMLAESDIPSIDTLWDVFTRLRSLFKPSLTGVGLTIAVLDSGINITHESMDIADKIVYSANFSGSSSTNDIFGHGTQVAFAAAGGTHGSKMAGTAPGASLMNIKVINDSGIATDETLVLGIEKVCELVEQAQEQGLHPTNAMYPNIINLSLGAADDGDPDSPTRIACRNAITKYGVECIAAAGNEGPKMTTIVAPATDPLVIAVGAIETKDEIAIWEKSSRGPTLEGETKPDFVIWGTDIVSASHLNDDEYITNSGTSFAVPMLSGITGLLWETGRRSYGDSWIFKWSEAKKYASYFCMLPEGEPVKKGNVYGHGLPAAWTMMRQITGVSTSAQEMMPFMMTIMIMAMMMRAM